MRRKSTRKPPKVDFNINEKEKNRKYDFFL